MEPVGALSASLIFGALVLKLTDFVKYLRQADWNGVVTILIGWLVGWLAIVVIGLTEWDKEINVGSQSLDKLDWKAELVLAFVLTSVAGVLYDFKKAVDSTDTASTPRITNEAERQRKAALEQALPGSTT